ncbi:urea carboxylase-associated family protein [Kiloniella laminariae]|uniref:urea carboxylase-associated family protein n=1 Tax=Kiloniella laminariae TaxID=454162 RepID=UPI000380EEE4|nr:DUF1989 domain-containing protein [Kiloniella laminariae]
MKTIHDHPAPKDADARKAVAPVICYPNTTLPAFDAAFFDRARAGMELVAETYIPPRDARCFEVPAGHFVRIVSIEGPQVGDLNFWNAHDLTERFFSGKTRALHGTHISTGDRLWSTLPHLRPLATVTRDTLDWYGFDEFGGGVHDVIGTRCDPYTNAVLQGTDYHYCCHSNLTRALAAHCSLPMDEAELLVHDVLNVFMCTGFTKDTHQYFMKASPVRPGDYLEFFAETDLLGGMSACPGGDCGSSHSGDAAACYPMKVEVYKPQAGTLEGWSPSRPSPYSGGHGVA